MPIVDEWIQKLWDIYIMECYMAVEKENSYLLQQQGWMDLEIIMLSDISTSQKDKYHMISLIGGI